MEYTKQKSNHACSIQLDKLHKMLLSILGNILNGKWFRFDHLSRLEIHLIMNLPNLLLNRVCLANRNFEMGNYQQGSFLNSS